jgi:hypothetical protein
MLAGPYRSHASGLQSSSQSQYSAAALQGYFQQLALLDTFSAEDAPGGFPKVLQAAQERLYRFFPEGKTRPVAARRAVVMANFVPVRGRLKGG